MPGPSRKAKSKSKSAGNASRVPRSVTPDAYIGDIDGAEGWHYIVVTLCDVLELPDLTTRSGLKKVHADFENIYRRLDTTYKKYADNERMTGGIVGIYAKMCADSILRNKLFERGFLSQLVPLLSVPSTRHVSLRALSSVTHHGGESIRVEIAKLAPTLTRLLKELPDDLVTGELSVSILSHSLVPVITGDDGPVYPNILRAIDLKDTLRQVTEALRRPGASIYLMDHANELISMAAMFCVKACRAYPPTMTFLVAGLRSKDWSFRCTSLAGVIRAHREQSVEDKANLDPHTFLARIQRGFPHEIAPILSHYGPERCETYLTIKTSTDFQKAMMKCAQDRDLYALGISMAEFITRTEYSIAAGYFQTENPVTGALEEMDLGLPFRMWQDSLPHCAIAIRVRANPNEIDLAEILEIKFEIMQQRIGRAVELAEIGIKRNPKCAYFYYAISMCADHVQGLRAAKKGLKCKHITPFIKFQLLQRAVNHAGDMGQTIVHDSSVGEKKFEEGIAFLSSALEDAKTYIEEAPPDNRNMKNVLYWYIILTVLYKGPDMSEDLNELKTALKKLKIAEQITLFLTGSPPPNTNLRLAQQYIVNTYPEAVKEWGEIIVQRDKSAAEVGAAEAVVSPAKIKDDLAAWLEDLHLESGEAEPPLHCGHPKINDNHVQLYKCSWCRNPSAALRKCSGCEKTRYCDAACQKAHWSEHKKRCNVAT